MTKKEAKAWLIKKQPLMATPNSLEFKHRLGWLSEGMLANHLNSVITYDIDQREIADYLTYKGLLSHEN